ncbi:bifunctional [glutamine synthetase] adenylyltransferase/[glutamine synthetase]-adenylyl-L-tyrosine phosphorylase [Acuticoccus mangrovi]|uniref:Bifunctional [glutamine synthetase] adenylyltransferase/[glutamine synthetase]-adenylyl-L-tyrosine phosphorylase n=1 Tax=Acuticoccus mangrovi TaxID=2796142 RepID=A0A934IJ91_9HYPH|nr:bifunctional [glutamine synthetase] adenylyltransferase/[glutamine synthetase]-adenylyl-L-tyrosine phosphorylase [Acuticoccus mangrovi]MBJ3774752.1 bifunctional [glutamine synthetase] adenylyltransferase/[glutamine synthetase]-adenylyl-L-tyrosine phosphorylase [Acuticoccus mangrovi]
MTRPLADLLVPLDGPGDARFAETICPLDGVSERALAALATVADVSPYLAGLMSTHTAELQELLLRPLADTVAEATRLDPTADLAEAERRLRVAKAKISIAVGLADLCGGADVATVTRALSDMADAAIESALRSVLLDTAARGVVDDPDPARCGLVILGLGKLGAHELNYSSDVDLVALVDLDRARLRGIDQQRAVRMIQRVSKLLQARTADGYVFRVDLRLRPDPGSTPLAVSTRAAIRYFQSRARSWERQAMVKARQVAGDRVAGEAYLAAIEPSVWRSSYDFTAIDDAMEMREQIAMVRGAGDVTVPGHNVKLGRGGIREVEFFVQSLQRVAGGRDRRLRGRGTVAMLSALADAGWITARTRDILTVAYEHLRKAEHRVQMVADEQTHTLPAAAGLPRIARMMRDADFEATMRTTFEEVHREFATLPNIVAQHNPEFARLRNLGAHVPEAVHALFDARFAVWLEGGYTSLRTPRARRLLEDLKADFLTATALTPDPEATLVELDNFFARLPAGVDLLARLDLQRDLIPVLVLIVSAAPRLAAELTRRAHLLDVLVDPAFFGTLPDVEGLRAELAHRLSLQPDYEARLDAMRVFGQEQMLLINVRILTGSLAGREAGEATTRLADVLAPTALDVAREEFETRHGSFPEADVALIALGKFGSREMTATSDLDLVFLYDCAEDAGESDGDKPLSPGHYYTRLAQRFIAALSAPTARGTLYDVDLRLRPSGRSGPIATHIRSFERYHTESAWTWEHMALTRARVVAGKTPLVARAIATIDAALTAPRDRTVLAEEVAAMRRRMAEQHATGLKHAPGGQVDVEFIAQFLQLAEGLLALDEATSTPAALARALTAGALEEDAYEILVGAHGLYQRLSQLLAIAGVGERPIVEAPSALKPLLVRAGEAPDMEFLISDIADRRRMVRELFETIVAPLTT